MKFHVLAVDYDGCLADNGHVDAATVDLLVRLRQSGRRLVLVTGRLLKPLLDAFPEVGLCDLVVAENGALLYNPDTREERQLAETPPREFEEKLVKQVDPLPVYTPRDWQPSKEYPLYLINWKEASHTHTRTQNNEWLLELKPSAPLIIHPETAAQQGISDGDDIFVESPYGQVKGTVKITKRIHPEVIGLQHGFGHTALGARAKGRGTSDSILRPTKADPLSGQALHKEACVRIRRA